MADQNVIECSEHQKQCTDYCTFNFCEEKYLFICPRCIQRKMNHTQHKNCLKDISSQKDIMEVILDIMMNNSDYTYEKHQIQKLLDLNEYFIDSLNKINSGIRNQMSQMLQNDQQLFQFILQNSQISNNNNNIQSNTITKVIKKIIQDSIFHDNSLYKHISDQLKSVYQDIGKQISNFDIVVDKNLEQKKNSFTKSIQRQFQKIDEFQQQSLNDKINNLNEQSSYFENDVSINSAVSVSNDNQNNDMDISKVNINQVLDLFSSNISGNQPKKILIQNPVASSKKEKQVNFSIQSIQQRESKENAFDNQMMEEEESKYDNINQIRHYQDNENQLKNKQLENVNHKENIKKIKQLTSFQPNLIAKEPLGEVSIFCINENSKMILLTHSQLPNILQRYDLNIMGFHDQNMIQFDDGDIVDAHLSEDLQKIAICSSRAGQIYKLVDGKSYQLSTNKDKNICRIQVEKNGNTIVIYEDFSFEIYQYDNIQPYQYFPTDSISDQKKTCYFVQIIESNIALQLIQNKCLQVINLQNNLSLFSKQEKYCLNSIEINNEKNLIATSGLSEIVTIYSYDKEKKSFTDLIKIETGHNDEILQTKFINGDQWIVTISGDCTWKVFETRTGQTIYFSSNDSQNAYIKCEYFASDQSLIFIDQYGELALFKLQ
ncbi:hypothetical protein TTHERM_00470430 (macronuclear) [Tetrahymena thermophila SB210]|uniref:WD domain, G-beta repeat protein n=1 Tax=Tetrahymena thermophila (strain SB210) TaxID=312017 RepID=I7M009_TETTS|nr:hypothetical protein TTHERM_00470430 [Tetrahymena thermophila SB210]EAR85270.1 hypothetical protein TTHERM_00470430 [Tetrahymena thermophila SB210]|eukprot:XP_001032933.1 hypothetical protein TTHERM_00470430 [Tetrahymena thermophila SB210]